MASVPLANCDAFLRVEMSEIATSWFCEFVEYAVCMSSRLVVSVDAESYNCLTAAGRFAGGVPVSFWPPTPPATGVPRPFARSGPATTDVDDCRPTYTWTGLKKT